LRELNEKGTWTRDNFGPLTIPSDMAFFMGDNRHYSYDCRFYGFVPIEDITGTVLWK
ncbi:MAG: signal peptidase I, partial [Bacteroidia bacterium]